MLQIRQLARLRGKCLRVKRAIRHNHRDAAVIMDILGKIHLTYHLNHFLPQPPYQFIIAKLLPLAIDHKFPPFLLYLISSYPCAAAFSNASANSFTLPNRFSGSFSNAFMMTCSTSGETTAPRSFIEGTGSCKC